MNIQISTKRALETLKKNRENHINEFAVQIQGWKKSMEEFSLELAKWRDSISDDIFNTEEATKRPNEPIKPVSYVDSYDNFIELLENHEGSLVELAEYEYQQIIKDEFGWKHNFLSNSALYSMK